MGFSREKCDIWQLAANCLICSCFSSAEWHWVWQPVYILCTALTDMACAVQFFSFFSSFIAVVLTSPKWNSQDWRSWWAARQMNWMRTLKSHVSLHSFVEESWFLEAVEDLALRVAFGEFWSSPLSVMWLRRRCYVSWVSYSIGAFFLGLWSSVRWWGIHQRSLTFSVLTWWDKQGCIQMPRYVRNRWR